MNPNAVFERLHRTAPKQAFSGGHVSHGRILPAEDKRPWWRLGR